VRQAASADEEEQEANLVNVEDNNNNQNNVSGITNYSLEIEMLNKMQVQKNYNCKLSQLPVVCDQFIPDSSLLYIEEKDPNGNTVKFFKDQRHKICFRDPYNGVSSNVTTNRAQTD
jgi:hypothetical protein